MVGPSPLYSINNPLFHSTLSLLGSLFPFFSALFGTPVVLNVASAMLQSLFLNVSHAFVCSHFLLPLFCRPLWREPMSYYALPHAAASSEALTVKQSSSCVALAGIVVCGTALATMFFPIGSTMLFTQPTQTSILSNGQAPVMVRSAGVPASPSIGLDTPQYARPIDPGAASVARITPMRDFLRTDTTYSQPNAFVSSACFFVGVVSAAVMLFKQAAKVTPF